MPSPLGAMWMPPKTRKKANCASVEGEEGRQIGRFFGAFWGLQGRPCDPSAPFQVHFRAYLILGLFNKTNAFKSSPRFALPNSSKFFSRLVIVSSRGRVLLKLPSTLPAPPFHIQGVLAVLWLRQPRRGVVAAWLWRLPGLRCQGWQEGLRPLRE